MQSDLLLSAPSVAVRNDAAGASVHINCSGDNAAGISSLGSDGKSRYSRFAVGMPTGDNDAATKAYVDGRTHDYYDVTVTSSADAAQTIDGGIIDVRGSADKTVAEIAAAYAAGAIVRCIYNGNIMRLMRATMVAILLRESVRTTAWRDLAISRLRSCPRPTVTRR